MKPENPTYIKRILTHADRDIILKLSKSGLNAIEITELTHCGRSTIYHTLQAHEACVAKDWSTIQRLSKTAAAAVEWAMKVTGTDKAFLETFGEPNTAEEPVATPAPEVITRDDILAMYAVMQDVRALLTEIRDTLK